MGTKTSDLFSTAVQENTKKETDHRKPRVSPAKTYLSDGVLESVLGELAEAETALSDAKESKKNAGDALGEWVQKSFEGDHRQSLKHLLGELENAAGVNLGAQAVMPEPEPDRIPRSRYLIFQVANLCIAIPLDQVMEVGDTPATTWVPNLPSWIRGVTHLRGEIYTVIDSRNIFGLAPSVGPVKEQRILIRTRSDEMRTVLMADRVLGIRSLKEPAKPEIKPSLSPEIDPFIRGVAEWEDRALAFFDLDPFLNSPQLHPWRESAAVS